MDDKFKINGLKGFPRLKTNPRTVYLSISYIKGCFSKNRKRKRPVKARPRDWTSGHDIGEMSWT